MRLTISCSSEPVEIEATSIEETDGVFALHPARHADGWTVTHVPTGLFIVRAPTAEQARSLIGRFWSEISEVGREVFRRPTYDPRAVPIDDRRLGQAMREAARDLWHAEEDARR